MPKRDRNAWQDDDWIGGYVFCDPEFIIGEFCTIVNYFLGSRGDVATFPQTLRAFHATEQQRLLDDQAANVTKAAQG